VPWDLQSPNTARWMGLPYRHRASPKQVSTLHCVSTAAILCAAVAACSRRGLVRFEAALCGAGAATRPGQTAGLALHSVWWGEGHCTLRRTRLAAETAVTHLVDAGDRFRASELSCGQEVEGTVKMVSSMGVWVDIGVEKKKGLIAVGEWREDGGFPLDWPNITAIRGTTVSARVLDVRRSDIFLTRRSGDLKRKRYAPIRLNRTATLEWAAVSPTSWFTGRVVGMAPWGVYVALQRWPSPYVQGLVHKTSFAEDFPSQATVGQQVKVRVVNVDTIKLSIALSMRDPDSK